MVGAPLERREVNPDLSGQSGKIPLIAAKNWHEVVIRMLPLLDDVTPDKSDKCVGAPL